MWNKRYSGTLGSLPERPTASYLLRPELLEQLLRERLPLSWRVEPDVNPIRFGADALVWVFAPDGESALVTVEAKSRVDPRDVPHLADQLDRYSDGPKVVLAPFLAPSTQEALTRRGIGYVDLTGNMYLMVDKPAIFIRDRGATSDPWREERAIRSLKGPTAGRVVRALSDFRPPYGIRELAEKSGTPPASVSRVISFLDREDLVDRGERGQVMAVKWPDLIRRWTQDYSLTKSNRTYTFLEARGTKALLEKLVESRTFGRKYAVTGSLAAVEVAPFAPPRLATLYVENAMRTAEDLDLRSTESGANVLIVEPFDSVVFDRTWTRNDVAYAALSQVAADLLTSPGRAPAEGEELIRWMEENEDAWRS